LLELYAKWSARRNLSLFTFRKKNACDSDACARYTSQNRAFASAGDSAKNGADRSAAAYEDGGPVVTLSRHATLVVDMAPSFRIRRG